MSPTNEQHREHAQTALQLYENRRPDESAHKGEPDFLMQEHLPDLLADLMHLAAGHGVNFDDAIESAKRNFLEEQKADLL
ncbi:hypothetical protein [Methylocella tundrae]|uniref:Uncharacterized protein n=1 Tax=Methylocella tundrae TaxID=227605 RepID=A0A4U8Z7K6_METTU|nr:hypothetical protein [Methylocella tundrae]WPP02747.1 hypothetical protein SIN04_00120 [Methylocella tundrae]VFU17507.1 protein of unknown function [Methylocella tundrae]